MKLNIIRYLLVHEVDIKAVKEIHMHKLIYAIYNQSTNELRTYCKILITRWKKQSMNLKAEGNLLYLYVACNLQYNDTRDVISNEKLTQRKNVNMVEASDIITNKRFVNVKDYQNKETKKCSTNFTSAAKSIQNTLANNKNRKNLANYNKGSVINNKTNKTNGVIKNDREIMESKSHITVEDDIYMNNNLDEDSARINKDVNNEIAEGITNNVDKEMKSSKACEDNEKMDYDYNQERKSDDEYNKGSKTKLSDTLKNIKEYRYNIAGQNRVKNEAKMKKRKSKFKLISSKQIKANKYVTVKRTEREIRKVRSNVKNALIGIIEEDLAIALEEGKLNLLL